VVGSSGSKVRAETIFIPARGELVFMTKGFEIVYHKRTFPNQRQVNFFYSVECCLLWRDKRTNKQQNIVMVKINANLNCSFHARQLLTVSCFVTNFVTKIKLNWKYTVVCTLCVWGFGDLFSRGGSFCNFSVSGSWLKKWQVFTLGFGDV